MAWGIGDDGWTFEPTRGLGVGATHTQLGNEFFAEGRYQWAKKTYSEAVTAIQYGIYIGCEGPECVPNIRPAITKRCLSRN